MIKSISRSLPFDFSRLPLLLHFLIFDLNWNDSHPGWFLTPNIWAVMILLLLSCRCWCKCGCSAASFLHIFIGGGFKCWDNLNIIIIVFGGGGRRASARCIIKLLDFYRIILHSTKIGADWWWRRSDTRTLFHLRKQIEKTQIRSICISNRKLEKC